MENGSPLGLVSLDGVPLDYEGNNKSNGKSNEIQWKQNILLPPGGRAEFVFESPAQGGQAQLLAAGVNTAPFEDEDEDDDNPFSADAVAHKAALPDDDDYTPPRWLLKVVAVGDAPEPASVIPKSPSHREALGLSPAHERAPC